MRCRPIAASVISCEERRLLLMARDTRMGPTETAMGKNFINCYNDEQQTTYQPAATFRRLCCNTLQTTDHDLVRLKF